MATSSPSKPFSISLSAKRKPAKPINHRKRPHSSLAEDESENEDSASKAQLVTAFDHSAGGAIGIDDQEQKSGPLVIRAQKNRDWRAESYRKKGKNLLPEEVQALRSGVTRHHPTAAKDSPPPEFGLTFVRPKDKGSDGDSTNGDRDAATENSADAVGPPDEDEEAINALLGKDVKGNTLVLQTASNDREVKDAWTQRGNEDEIFRSDVLTRPDPPSLDDYANVPVEVYGAAMLRGMKKGNIVGDQNSQAPKPRDLARRPALLGIGAKEVPDEIEELGAWGKAAKGKRKIEKIYNPVLLRNSETGEMISEEELERRKQNGKMEESDWRERRDRNLALDAEKKGGRKPELEDGGRRSGHERHERDRSPELNHSRSNKRNRSRSPEQERYRASGRERSRSSEYSRHSFSRRDRSRSPKRSRHRSSRQDERRSSERKNSKRDRYGDHGDYELSDRDSRQGYRN